MLEGPVGELPVDQAQGVDEVVAVDEESVGHGEPPKKKERRSCLRLLSMGIGRRNGRFRGMSELFEVIKVLLFHGGLDAVFTAQPAT